MNRNVAFPTIARTMRGTVPRGAACCALLLAGAVAAQDAAELSNLIFDPVPLAADAVPRNLTLPGAVDRAALEADVAAHLAAIESFRGSRSRRRELIQRLGLLAVAFQGLDRHEEALAALDEAIELERDLGGRNSLDQIPLLEQQIPSYLALADIRRVDDAEETIFELKERAYDAGGRQMYYAAINLADWYTSAYYRENYGAGRNVLRRQMGVVQRTPRQIVSPGAGGEDPSPANSSLAAIFSGNIKDVADQDITDIRLRKIDRLYKDYQEEMIERDAAQLDVIIDLAKRIARLAFTTKQEMDFERDNRFFDPIYEGSREQALRNSPARLNESYLTGERALRYAIELPSSSVSLRPEALAALQLDLGDWHLAYGKAAAAEEAYGEAYRVLLDAGFTKENIDIAVNAPLPVRIPVFAVHLYTRRSRGLMSPEAALLKGYVDVAYSIDSLGNASQIEFIGGSSENDGEIRRLLDIQLQSMKFRPTLDGGELVSPGRVEARYFYSY